MITEIDVDTALKVTTRQQSFRVDGELFTGQETKLHTVEAEITAKYAGQTFHWKGHITPFTTEQVDDEAIVQALHELLSAELSRTKAHVTILNLAEAGASAKQLKYLLQRFEEFIKAVENQK